MTTSLEVNWEVKLLGWISGFAGQWLQQEELDRVVRVDVDVVENRLHGATTQLLDQLNEIVAHQPLQKIPRVAHVRLVARSDKPALPTGKRVPEDDRDRVRADDGTGLGRPMAGVSAKKLNRAARDVGSERAGLRLDLVSRMFICRML